MSNLLRFSLAINVLGLVLALVAMHKLGGFKYLLFRMQHDGVPAMHLHTKDFYEKMANAKTEKQTTDSTIVLIGDSITEFGHWDELLGEYTNAKIINRGIVADQILGVQNRLSTIKSLAPKQIFLMIGVNDLFFRKGEQVAKDYTELVNALRAQFPATTLVLQTIIPVNNEVQSTGVSNEEIRIVNAEIAALATSLHLPLLDVGALLKDKNSEQLDAMYTADGVHLNGSAYMVWAKALQPMLIE